MEGTTEPIIAIIGNPIAGNPSQFAIERALREMDLEWRVLSFNVLEDDIVAALDGFAVLGIQGVLVDASVSAATARWYAARHESNDDVPTQPIDCLYRDQDGRLVGSYELGDWLRHSDAESEVDPESDESPPPPPAPAPEENWVWIGDDEDEASTLCAVPPYQRVDPPPDPRVIAAADFVVLAEISELEPEDWPADEGSTMVIDLTDGHPERLQLEELGYRFIDEIERRAGTLSGCLQRWTQQQAPDDALRDAIEEYLGV